MTRYKDKVLISTTLRKDIYEKIKNNGLKINRLIYLGLEVFLRRIDLNKINEQENEKNQILIEIEKLRKKSYALSRLVEHFIKKYTLTENDIKNILSEVLNKDDIEEYLNILKTSA